jgi:hypothetical protein
MLSSYSQVFFLKTLFDSLGQRGLGVGLLGLIGHFYPLEPEFLLGQSRIWSWNLSSLYSICYASQKSISLEADRMLWMLACNHGYYKSL